MIISRGRAYIFIHIPKTGGTSIAAALEARAMKDDILIGDTPKAHRRAARQKSLVARGRLWKHSTLADIDGLVSRDEISRSFVFTIVRNPWDRVVSYYHWLRAQEFEHPAVSLARIKAFTGFLNDPQTIGNLRDWPARRYVTTASGEEKCDAYMRLEHLQSDLVPLEQHLGFSLGAVPILNTSARPTDYRSAFSDADADLVAKLCAEDIRRFGYAF